MDTSTADTAGSLLSSSSPRNVLVVKSPKGRSRSKEKAATSLMSSSTATIPSTASSKGKSTFKIPESWVNAPEFVPRWLAPSGGCDTNTNSSTIPSESSSNKPRSYADVVGHSHATDSQSNQIDSSQSSEWGEWCPYHLVGECRYGDQCLMIHGTRCDYCGENCLHPYDITQRDKHIKDCVSQHEKDMEISFAVARSIDKTCGICYEKVMSKEPASEQRFGILPSCTHCFCLSCIRRWRQAKNFENKIIRACPECRVTSDFVCPSRYWVDSKEDKDKLIGCYKNALGQKNCRYYRNGEGQCPFGNKCFYRHALPNGQVVDVGPPKRVMGADGRVPNGNQATTLWDFVEDWEFQWLDIEEIIEILDLDMEDLDIDDDSFDYWVGSDSSGSP